MRIYEREAFESIHDNGGAIAEDLEFQKCLFKSCTLSMGSDGSVPRTVVQNLYLKNCEFWACLCGAPIIKNVVIDTLKTNGLFQCFGAAFNGVVIRGRVGSLMISSVIKPGQASELQQRKIDALNEQFYATVDCALDLREAEFQECDLTRSGIPARLVLRDKETQAVLTREKALQGKWRAIPTPEWGVGIELFLKHGSPDVVLVAAKRARTFKTELEGLRKLRDAGVVEPD